MDQHSTPDGAVGAGHGAPLKQRKRFSPRWLALPVVAAGLAIAVSVLPPESDDVPVASTETISAVATPSAAPAPSATASAVGTPAPNIASGPAASRPTGLSFPAAEIEMSVLPLTPTDADLAAQTLVPPLTVDAYWLTPYGVPGADSVNTTYIAGHSWDGKDAPFNRLSDEALVGSEFTLTTETGAITYVVDGVVTHDKDTLKDSEIWNIVPGRVVLISCYTEDPWGKNVVVTAMPKTA
jgi:hypothetical protein